MLRVVGKTAYGWKSGGNPSKKFIVLPTIHVLGRCGASSEGLMVALTGIEERLVSAVY